MSPLRQDGYDSGPDEPSKATSSVADPLAKPEPEAGHAPLVESEREELERLRLLAKQQKSAERSASEETDATEAVESQAPSASKSAEASVPAESQAPPTIPAPEPAGKVEYEKAEIGDDIAPADIQTEQSEYSDFAMFEDSSKYAAPIRKDEAQTPMRSCLHRMPAVPTPITAQTPMISQSS